MTQYMQGNKRRSIYVGKVEVCASEVNPGQGNNRKGCGKRGESGKQEAATMYIVYYNQRREHSEEISDPMNR